MKCKSAEKWLLTRHSAYTLDDDHIDAGRFKQNNTSLYVGHVDLQPLL